MKKISPQQISQVLHTVYTTNIPVAQFDALKKFFDELEEIAEDPKKPENISKNTKK